MHSNRTIKNIISANTFFLFFLAFFAVFVLRSVAGTIVIFAITITGFHTYAFFVIFGLTLTN
jgi:hypothetical protein